MGASFLSQRSRGDYGILVTDLLEDVHGSPGQHTVSGEWTALELAFRYELMWGFPKIRSTLLRVPIIRITVCWDLYRDRPGFGKLP